MNNYKSDFVDFMLSADILRFGSFTLKSGRVSPYFMNAGNYRTGEHLAKLGDFYADAFMANVKNLDNVVLYGPAYKGIPLVVALSGSLYRKYGVNLPYFFNRKEAKDHGEGGVFVGAQPKAGDKIIIIEDVITAGTAVRESLELIKPTGAIVTSLLVSVDRMERGTGDTSAFQQLPIEFGVTPYAIVNLDDIVTAVTESGAVDSNMLKSIADYRAQYRARG